MAKKLKLLYGIIPYTGKISGITDTGQARKKSSKPPTVLQLEQQMKFELTILFLAPITRLINIGYFFSRYPNLPAINLATRYTLKHAICGAYPNCKIDYPNIRISRSRLSDNSYLTMTSIEDQQVNISWQERCWPSKNVLPTDKLMLLLYNETQHRFLQFEGAATRDDLSFTTQLPPDFIGDTIHGWAFFAGMSPKLVHAGSYLNKFILQSS